MMAWALAALVALLNAVFTWSIAIPTSVTSVTL